MILPVIKPFHYQLPFWNAMDNGCKRAILSWPRRHGKDLTCFAFLVREAMRRVGAYYYYFPTLTDADQALWKNVVTIGNFSGWLVDYLCPPELVLKKVDGDHIIYLKNGSIIRLRGTDNLKVVGMNGYGYVFSEWSLQKKEAFSLVSPILRENDGWALFNGTLRGKLNHLWKEIETLKDNKDWFVSYLTPEKSKAYYWSSPDSEHEDYVMRANIELEGKISPFDGRPYLNIQDVVDSGEMSYELARREYMNEPTSNAVDTYFGHQMHVLEKNGGVGEYEFNPKLPVYTFWDLGGSGDEADPTAIVFAQIQDKEFNVIDYHEDRGLMFEDYAKVLHSKPYSYAGHYAPHDAKKQMMFGDLISYAKRYGVDFKRVLKTNSVIDDIEVMRSNWSRLRFNKDTTDGLVAHIENYREGPAGKPVKNGSQHGVDGLRTMFMADHAKIITPYLGIRDTRYREEYYDDDGDYDDGDSYYLC
jgi:hypothetical protein